MKTKTKAEQSKNKQRWSLRCIALIMEITFFNYRPFQPIVSRNYTHSKTSDALTCTKSGPRLVLPPPRFHVILIEKWKGWSVYTISAKRFPIKFAGTILITIIPVILMDRSLFFERDWLFLERAVFFLQTTTTTTLGSAVLIPSEDSLGVAATSPRQRKNGEGATLRFSFVRGRVQLHVGYSEDGGWSLAHSESILTQQMANQGNIRGHPTTVSSKMHWKYFLGYSEYF